jgi:FtsP/CotA-like multicopper oxidase with cupredoxin domain
VTLDDVLVEDGKIAPFGHEPTFVAMGRFGNEMLVNGESELALEGRSGEVLRLYLTNTANTRVFNVGLPGARLKLVGGDSGRYEDEELVDSVVLAPSERAVVDVLLPEAGSVRSSTRRRAAPTRSARSRWATTRHGRRSRSSSRCCARTPT